MKVVQLICNHQVAVRFRSGAPEDSGAGTAAAVSKPLRQAIGRDHDCFRQWAVPLDIKFPNRSQRRNRSDHCARVIEDRGAEAVDAWRQVACHPRNPMLAYFGKPGFKLATNRGDGNLAGVGDIAKFLSQHRFKER